MNKVMDPITSCSVLRKDFVNLFIDCHSFFLDWFNMNSFNILCCGISYLKMFTRNYVTLRFPMSIFNFLHDMIMTM